MQLMVRLYGTYLSVRILKAQLYRIHDSLHDWTGIVRMNTRPHSIPSTSCITILISLQQMDRYYRYPVNYNVDNTIICMLIPKMAINSKNVCASALISRHRGARNSDTILYRVLEILTKTYNLLP